MEPRILFAKVRRVKQYSGLIFKAGAFIPSYVSNKAAQGLKSLWAWPFGSPERSRDHPATDALDSGLSCLF